MWSYSVRDTEFSSGVSSRRPLSPEATVFLASFLGLFLELALIRWVSCEIRVFAYCKNLVLVASFLGFGVGCLLSRRPVELLRGMFLLLLLVLLVQLGQPMLQDYGPRRVTAVLSELPGFMIFRHIELDIGWGLLARLAFAVGWTSALFFMIAVVMIPFGQVTASGISELSRPLRGYSVNVAGSLAGILAYTLVTSVRLPPLYWFVPVVLTCLAISRETRERQGLIGIGLGLLLILLPYDGPGFREIWSSYQKLALYENGYVLVNNIGYQRMLAQRPMVSEKNVWIDRFSMPYALRLPPGHVLVIGAGTGNDVAAALGAGASSVTAVEIDRTIYRIGHELHPQLPYSNDRVDVVIDDARHYLKTSNQSFDLIVFSHLDSHTVLSSFTNVRLDNYIYTVEAFREARARLAPGGILYVSFFSELPFIGERLSRNLSEAFGHPPISLEGTRGGEFGRGWRHIYFMTAEPGDMANIETAATSWEGFRRVQYDGRRIVPSTDDWPFLPLESRRIPPIMLLISGVILLLSAGFAWRMRPAGDVFDGRVFWLGAAFMLLEVHDVSRLALVFGTTWKVNAWVIGAILGIILLANALCEWAQRGGRRLARGAAAGLFVTLGLAYFVPLHVFLALPRLVGEAGATLMLTLPILFAGLVFAEAFSESPSPGFALGWNALGAVTGGMAENLSYSFGVPALVPLAAGFYFVALVWARSSGSIRRRR